MKKAVLVVIVIVGSYFLWNIAKPDPVKKISQNNTTKITGSTTIIPQKEANEYLFVPYWSFTKNLVTDSKYSLIYFGVGVSATGLELNDKGYENLNQFITQTPNAKERILAIRMVDKSVNAEIIKNNLLQEKIASQAVTLAIKNKFDGVLLDYETSAFAFDSTTNNITAFYNQFAIHAHDAKLKFYVSLYGDSYFQSRPFDVKAIGEVADKVLIMTYDFSKSGGNPGPNFPLTGRDKYGYDLGKMVDDFQKDVSNEKIVVIFGYFGYNWRVDSSGNSLASGVPLTTTEITKEFITKCGFKKCELSRIPQSEEPSIRYTDDNEQNHIIWFEDSASIGKKKEFLKTKGILEVAFWAYSYF